ncbi:ribbon-helix-helix domain-containing protein [Aneurinibacillus uraniidurans]|nr:hypothetical protein [Aneurinibacillus sp. B1]WCN39403.1 hypothetical protein PO771_08440 [Aneurinibacillus sp. B1]
MAIANENARIIVTVPKELKEQLQEEEKKESRSLSNYIMMLLQNHTTLK